MNKKTYFIIIVLIVLGAIACFVFLGKGDANNEQNQSDKHSKEENSEIVIDQNDDEETDEEEAFTPETKQDASKETQEQIKSEAKTEQSVENDIIQDDDVTKPDETTDSKKEQPEEGREPISLPRIEL